MTTPHDHFVAVEAKDGVRFSWNVFPSTRIEAARMAVPIGCIYTPLKKIDHLQTVESAPVVCSARGCGCVLNPYCRVDFINKLWMCPMCRNRNHFPTGYVLNAQNRPTEIVPQNTTIEYLTDQKEVPPTFVFVIDICNFEDEIHALKDCITQNIMLLPEDANVGLITFGKNVYVHQLSSEECVRHMVFNGSKAYTAQEVASLMGLSSDGKSPAVDTKYIVPLADAELTITEHLENLRVDCWPLGRGQRWANAAGCAMSVATSLLGATKSGQPGRIMVFLGGPTTVGPGLIVSTDLKESIRSHHEIKKNTATHHKAATDFYEAISKRLCAAGHIMDIFACALDQLGLAEMRSMVERTGGYLVLDDSFTKPVFNGSFKRIFAQGGEDLGVAFNGKLQVLCSPDLKVEGVVGNVTSLNQTSASVSDDTQGIGGTCAWRLGGMDNTCSLSVYFNISASPRSTEQKGEQKQVYIQLLTAYQHSTGQRRLRVTTICKSFADCKEEKGKTYIRHSFDQEAAAVIMARLAVYKTLNTNIFDIRRWLDRMLIRLVQKFATFKADQASTFRLPSEFSYYPQFMFHLRRSQFLQIFNCTPDETAFFRIILTRENVSNSLVMLQPSLVSYSLEGPAQPVVLDVTAMQPNVILFLDTFFHVVVWAGRSINSWQEQKVQDRPGYEYFAQLLKAPKTDAANLIKTRFPFPMYIETIEGGSQERFLLSKLNPSVNQSNVPDGSTAPIISEDVTFKIFMQHLRKLAVAS